ncbi:hypothetical protein MPSEU_000552300 [Mayamaea pseudoterrestris]|nr:hypothetical protein MPSEU_000552300 [Mayamaea pseudoterrestris]
MMLTDSRHHAYCAAVSLNNAGVSMLAQGCLHQAHKTFQDATVVLQQVCQSRTATSKPSVRHLLQQACQRRAHPQPVKLLRRTKSLSCDPSMPPSASTMQSMMSSDETFAIKIDLISMDCSNSSTMTTRNPNVESSIIIYNCGVTSFLLAQLLHGNSSCNTLLRNAYKFFHLSAQVSSAFDSQCSENNHHDEGVVACHLIMALVAIKSLLVVVDYADEQHTGSATNTKFTIDCNVDYFTRLRDDICMELDAWQQGTNLLMLLLDPTVAASA